MAKVKMYKKLEPIQKVAIVNARLRHGDISRIAKSVGTNTTKVTNVIEGTVEDSKILNAAYDLTRKRKKNTEIIRSLESKNRKANQIQAVTSK